MAKRWIKRDVSLGATMEAAVKPDSASRITHHPMDYGLEQPGLVVF